MGPEVTAAAAAVSSIAGLGLKAAGQVEAGQAKATELQGQSDSQQFLAARDERAAAIGRLKADQTDVGMREQLHTTLANIDAVRAASSIDPNSPTTAALKAEEIRIGDRQRTTAVGNILAQVNEDETSAAYRRKLATDALMAKGRATTSGWLGAGSTLLSGLASPLAGLAGKNSDVGDYGGSPATNWRLKPYG